MSKKVITLEKLNRFWTKVKTYLGQYILKTDIVNTFTSTDSSKVAAATTVKTLKDEINQLNTKIYVEKITGTFPGAEVGDSGYLAIGTRNIGGKTLVPIAAVPAVATLNFKAEIVNTSDFMIHLMMYNGTQIKYDVETDVFVLFVCVA